MLSSRSAIRSPFTATQWQELEHQALIYKYMVSGVPIPPELLYSVKRSLESSLATRFFPNQQPVGWGCFQVGYGRKPDPEPGRCRRTDGKKWRCSKEAYPDSKYCEKHMHRGKNRSRKPVKDQHQPEQLGSSSNNTTAPTLIASPSLVLSSSSTANTSSTTSPSPSSSSYSFSPLSSASSLEPDHLNHGNMMNPFLYTAAHSPASGLFMDASSGSSSHADKDYRYYQGIREGMDEIAFFPALSSYRGYPQSQFQCFGDAPKPLDDHHHQEENHCYVLGTDFKSQASRPIKSEKADDDDDDNTHKPIHHFFGDQWPQKTTTSDSWLDLASSAHQDYSPW